MRNPFSDDMEAASSGAKGFTARSATNENQSNAVQAAQEPPTMCRPSERAKIHQPGKSVATENLRTQVPLARCVDGAEAPSVKASAWEKTIAAITVDPAFDKAHIKNNPDTSSNPQVFRRSVDESAVSVATAKAPHANHRVASHKRKAGIPTGSTDIWTAMEAANQRIHRENQIRSGTAAGLSDQTAPCHPGAGQTPARIQ
jgi:hypothetical protein